MPQRYYMKNGKRTIHRNPAYLAALFMALLCLTGCDFSRTEPDVTKAEIGMGAADVVSKLGQPMHVIAGGGLYTGWEEWVYENGSLIMFRLNVKHIINRAPDAPIPSEHEDARWTFKNLPEEERTLMEIDRMLKMEKQDKREQKK